METLSFHELADRIVELGKYLEEKSISPNILSRITKRDALCTTHPYEAHLVFQISNIQHDFASEVILHGVKQWGMKYKRPVPLIEFGKNWQEVQGIVITVPLSAMEYTTLNHADSGHIILKIHHTFDDLRRELEYQKERLYKFVSGYKNVVYGTNMYVIPSPIKRLNFNLSIDNIDEETK